MRRFLLANCLTAVLLLTSYGLWAQERTVSGRITSSDDGSSLPGVNVIVKGTTTGAVTDSDGNYTISVPQSGGTLVFSFIGLKSEEIQIGGQSQINVQMATDITQLSEVIVTGYASTPKRSVTGSIASIKGDDIENLPLQSFDRALQGRAAGVLVQSNTGIPGGAVTVRIRGQGSLGAGNDPLYIVDGVQMNTRNDANFTQTNPLSFLNPNDIESMEVLKDAATAAIYGAQAANGVVIITTKKGKKGKTKIDLNYYTGVADQFKQLEVLDTKSWFELRKNMYMNSYVQNGVANETGASYFALRDMSLLPAGSPNLTYTTANNIVAANNLDPTVLQLGRFDDGTIQTYDWQKEAFRTGKVQNMELSASGGDDKTTFFLSGSYIKQEAIVYPVDFERGTFKASLKNQITDKVSFETNLNLSSFQQNVPFVVAGSSLGSPAFASSTILPFNRIFNEDGTYNTAILGVLNQNPVQVANQNSGYNRTNQMVGNIAVNYQIQKNLVWRSTAGLDYRLVQGENYRDPRTPDGAGVRGRGSVQSNWNVNFISFHTLNYNTTINADHNFGGIAGFEYRSETNEGLAGSAIGFPTYQFRTIQSAATPETITGFWTGFKRLGAFGKISYDFRKKYLVEFTGRYDGSSRFGADNLYGFFPSVSAGWIVKEESFLKDVNSISELKIRASYGQTGNDQIGNFDSRGLYGGGVNYAGSPGIRPTQLPNPALRWERNESVNLGLDLGLFNGRVTTAVDVYKRTTKDLLLPQPLPWTSGFDNTTANIGEVVNQGLEIELSTINVERGSFSWRTSFNVSFNQNEITKLYGGLDELPGDPSMRVGEAIGTWYVAPYAGVNPANGRPMWLDINDNITYQPLAADRRVVGDLQPNAFGGLNNTISYKGLELVVFFQYEYGRTVSDTQVSFLRENGTRLALNALQETADARWTTPGQVTWIPGAFLNGPPARSSGVTAGSANLQDAEYIRLKQVSLSYNIPSNLLSKIRVNSAKIYAQGVNLWTYSDYRGYDPEWNFGVVGTNTAGLIPQSRNYTIGLQIGL
jgi:TonB-dependent starch-binding outer membrane protein SusC